MTNAVAISRAAASSPAELELLYLHNVLTALPPERHTVLDRGVDRGKSARMLEEMRFGQWVSTHRAQDDPGPGFMRVDLPGQPDAGAFKSLLPNNRGQAPWVLTFTADVNFPDGVRACLEFLLAYGYDRFDVIYRDGLMPIAAERFAQPKLPSQWSAFGQRPFSATFVAYHESAAMLDLPSPVQFVRQCFLNESRELLRQTLEIERQYPPGDSRHCAPIRETLRRALLDENPPAVFSRPVCQAMLAREPLDLSRLSAESRPPWEPQASVQAILGRLTRIRPRRGALVPQRIVEIAAGYGAMAYAYHRFNPNCTYVIFDVAEALAAQYYLLSLSLPHRRVTALLTPDAPPPQPGEVTLVPVGLLGKIPVAADVLVCSQQAGTVLDDLCRRVERADYLSATEVVVGLAPDVAGTAGCARFEHAVAPLRARFADMQIEAAPAGEGCLLHARRLHKPLV